MRELNKVGKFLFEDFGNVGFSRIRADRHSHGDSAATERAGRYANVSAAAWRMVNVMRFPRLTIEDEEVTLD